MGVIEMGERVFRVLGVAQQKRWRRSLVEGLIREGLLRRRHGVGKGDVRDLLVQGVLEVVEEAVAETATATEDHQDTKAPRTETATATAGSRKGAKTPRTETATATAGSRKGAKTPRTATE